MTYNLRYFLKLVERFLRFFFSNARLRVLQLILGSTANFFKSCYGRFEELDKVNRRYLKIQVLICKRVEELEEAGLYSLEFQKT